MNIAILLLAFNRPNTVEKVFEIIRNIRPAKLYVAIDGARKNKINEDLQVEKVKKITSQVDWVCDYKTLYRNENLGCKDAVSSALDWFFEHEEKGIILEDDCLPTESFFEFCEVNLNRYEFDKRIAAITGNNFQNGKKFGDGSYYFSRYCHIWGWATWRRSWQERDINIKFWDEWKNSKEWKSLFECKIEEKYWAEIFNKTRNNKYNTWDYAWTASVWKNGGLTITPNVNMVSNIGFDANGTHTTSKKHKLANMPTCEIIEIKHPIAIARCVEADKRIFDLVFNGKYFKFPLKQIRGIKNSLFRK